MSQLFGRGGTQPLQDRIDKSDPESDYWVKRADRALAALAGRMNYLAYVGWHDAHAGGTWKAFCEAAEAKLEELG